MGELLQPDLLQEYEKLGGEAFMTRLNGLDQFFQPLSAPSKKTLRRRLKRKQKLSKVSDKASIAAFKLSERLRRKRTIFEERKRTIVLKAVSKAASRIRKARSGSIYD